MAGINPHPRFLLKESVYWSICVFFRSTLCERRKQNDKKAVGRGGRGGRGRCKTEEYRLLSYSLPYYTARAHTGLVHLRFWSFSHCCQGGRFPTVVRVVVFLLHSGWSFSRCFVFPQFLGVVVFPLLSGWSFSHCCQGGRFLAAFNGGRLPFQSCRFPAAFRGACWLLRQ